MSQTIAAIICSNPACRIAEGGKCVEGLERDKCPHFGKTPQPQAEEPDEGDVGIALAAGGTLEIGEAEAVLRAGEARLIAIIGPSDAGKTSLIASLYDLFQEGPVADVEFAGSLSLSEFENICHDARAASQRGTPSISRTPRGEVRFYHLDVAGRKAGVRGSLLLGDRAGEEYRGVIDDGSTAAAFSEIQRADTLTLLVDGERLLDTGARHNLRTEVMMILRVLWEERIISQGMRLGLVLTKIDLIAASQRRAAAEADFVGLLANISKQFPCFSTVRSFRIAASPKNGGIRRGDGIADLLTFWLDPPNIIRTLSAEPPPPASRVFARLRPIQEAAEPL